MGTQVNPVRAHRSPRLNELNDSCLKHILDYLDPLPDRFSLAVTCRRLSCMALDRRSWLVVTGRPVQRPHPDAPGHTRTFSTLAEAVQASQPGHTILLQGGQPHRVSGQPVVIRHALRLLGSGGRAEAVVLRGDPGLETVLLFHSLAQLLNLSVHSVRGACLMHLAGTLRVGGCILESSAAGLPHLVSQIALAGDAAERRRLHFDETRLLGDCARPVATGGMGRVLNARAIYLRHQTYAWFDVHELGQEGSRAHPPAGAPATAKEKSTLKSPVQQPKWAAAIDPDRLRGAVAQAGAHAGRRSGSARPDDITWHNEADAGPAQTAIPFPKRQRSSPAQSGWTDWMAS
ncbi:hypothetical protein ACKKBG_A26930 [Auxenochlorella protothecoides x Auxenochlorella symbiontica]